MSSKTEGDTPNHGYNNPIPDDKLLALGKPSDNANATTTSSREYLKTSARDLTFNFDKHNQELFDKKANGPTRLCKMIFMKQLRNKNPGLAEKHSRLAALENFQVDIFSPSDNLPLLTTLTLDQASLDCIDTTLVQLNEDVTARSFSVVARTLPLCELGSKAVQDALAEGKFSMTLSHKLITEPAHLHSKYVGKLSKNGHSNAGEICDNAQFMRAQPKMCIVKTQKLYWKEQKLAAEKGQEYAITEHENVESLKIRKKEYRTKVIKAVVDFQKNRFEELTAEINSNITIEVKLVPRNHFDELGRHPKDYDRLK